MRDPERDARAAAHPQLSNLREGRLSEEETCLRTCWSAWDGRDRALKEAIAARASAKSSSGPSRQTSNSRRCLRAAHPALKFDVEC